MPEYSISKCHQSFSISLFVIYMTNLQDQEESQNFDFKCMHAIQRRKSNAAGQNRIQHPDKFSFLAQEPSNGAVLLYAIIFIDQLQIKEDDLISPTHCILGTKCLATCS